MRYRTRLLLVVFVMFIGAAASGAIFWNNPLGAAPHSAADVRRRICETPVQTSVGGAAAILRQNTLAAGSTLLGGFTLGLRLVTQLLHFGFDFMELYLKAMRQSQSHWFAMAALLPHGVPELGAFAAMGATGTQIAALLLRMLMRRGAPGRGEILHLLRELPVPLAVLVLAAVVEEYVTPYLMRSVVGC